MDTDLSHEALERFAAIEARLDALEESSGADGGSLHSDEPEDEVDGEE